MILQKDKKNNFRMTHRERFRRCMHFQTIDRGVHWEFGYLNETIKRWHKEGLPQKYENIENNDEIESYFGVDPVVWVPINIGIFPSFEGEKKILEKKENLIIIEMPDGKVYEQIIEGTKTIPHYIKFPIANRDDWKRFKERLEPNTPGRNTTDYKRLGEELRLCDKPVGINFGSFFGIPRDWIGFENIAMMCYDNRELIEEIVETLTTLYISQLEIALKECEVDFASGWEDICFRNGPIISPQMFREICVPRIKRVCNLLREHGCDVIWTDCDGDITQLVPLWLEAGINCMFPLEVHPGSDPVKFREMYGHRILLRGGLAKYQFAHSKKEIIAELKRVEKIVADGGYIPHGDHRIPEDVPYENYRYYVREKLNMLGWDKDKIEQIEPLRSVK